MSDPDRNERFEALVLVHLDAAYALARWIMRDEVQAEEAVQEAFLRAFRYFGAFRGDDARPWLLGIVRNTCYTLLARDGSAAAEAFEEDSIDEAAVAAGAVVTFPVNPEAAALASGDRELVQRCLRALPPQFREIIVLRELNECSYRHIAEIVGMPIGTVMSRLSRARRMLQRLMTEGAERKETGT